MMDFINISFFDILDIILVGLLIFEIIRLFRVTKATGILTGILILYAVWLIVRTLNMKLLSFILGQILGVGVIALIVIFQQEIRSFLFSIGRRFRNSAFSRIIAKLMAGTKSGNTIAPEVLDEITAACRHFSESKTGALIVMEHKDPLDKYIITGDEIDSRINGRLIENIFFKNTPLHDGAMIMTPDRIVAARCTLPMSSSTDIPPEYGMRHRASVGITEVSDATVIVVSEETGEISFVEKGVMSHLTNINELRLAVEKSYASEAEPKEKQSDS